MNEYIDAFSCYVRYFLFFGNGLTEMGELTVTVDTWRRTEDGKLTWKKVIGGKKKLRHRLSWYPAWLVWFTSFDEKLCSCLHGLRRYPHFTPLALT